MATKEKALIEKEGKMALKAKNTINGTGGTPIHVSTLQVHFKYFNKQESTICIYPRLGNLSQTGQKLNSKYGCALWPCTIRYFIFYIGLLFYEDVNRKLPTSSINLVTGEMRGLRLAHIPTGLIYQGKIKRQFVSLAG